MKKKPSELQLLKHQLRVIIAYSRRLEIKIDRGMASERDRQMFSFQIRKRNKVKAQIKKLEDEKKTTN